MRAYSYPTFIATCVAAGALFGAQPSAFALLDFFKKADKQVPTASERPAQDAAASAMLTEARAAQSGGNTSKALSLYDSILKRYPFTQVAPEAAYAKALIVRETGKLSDAFDAFQKLIGDYRSSPRFTDAIGQQFEIAEEAKGGKKQRSLLMIPMKLGSEDVVDMYRKVITNAPFGKFAPMAQFSIGEVYQDRGEKDLAVAAYQGVVDNYPNSKQAAEAQFRIGAIANIAAKRSEDSSNLISTRDALTSYVATNPAGERASEAEQILSQINAAEATQSLEVGKFYERQGKPKAAAIYYNEALKYGTAEASAEARELLSTLSQKYPEAMQASAGQPSQDFTVPAAVDLKGRDDYVGPPSPELAKLSEKAKMRTASDDFMPIPLQEPTLPTRPGGSGAVAPGSLLPPVDGGAMPLIPPVPEPPVPPAPSAGGIPQQPPAKGDLLPVPPVPPAPAPKPESN
jgi:outer membrane protein assembly factor BamD (BamD/ComL family)